MKPEQGLRRQSCLLKAFLLHKTKEAWRELHQEADESLQEFRCRCDALLEELRDLQAGDIYEAWSENVKQEYLGNILKEIADAVRSAGREHFRGSPYAREPATYGTVAGVAETEEIESDEGESSLGLGQQ